MDTHAGSAIAHANPLSPKYIKGALYSSRSPHSQLQYGLH